MEQQYEEPRHKPSTSYHSEHEEYPRSNKGKNLFSKSLTVNQRLILAMASLMLMLILPIIALLMLTSGMFLYSSDIASVRLSVILFVCFFGILAVNWIFNRKR